MIKYDSDRKAFGTTVQVRKKRFLHLWEVRLQALITEADYRFPGRLSTTVLFARGNQFCTEYLVAFEVSTDFGNKNRAAQTLDQ